MWLRNKDNNGRWARWEWEPKLTLEKLLRIREAIREAFVSYTQACQARGEALVRASQGELIIEAPLGFTPNDFIRRIVQEHSDGGKDLVTLFNIRFFFQSLQVGNGTWDSGPQGPYKKFTNVLSVTE
jgi:hypothetical protein